MKWVVTSIIVIEIYAGIVKIYSYTVYMYIYFAAKLVMLIRTRPSCGMVISYHMSKLSVSTILPYSLNVSMSINRL